METKLFRTSNWYRPLNVIDKNGKEYTLDNIIVYNDKGIVFQVGYGYFDNDEETTINGVVVKKIKETFKTKENYILKSLDSFGDNKYTLYIYIENIDLKYCGVFKKYDYLYYKYLINGIGVEVYKKSLSKKLNELNYKAELEVKKLQDIFRYNGKGYDEKELSKIMTNIKKLNKQIIAESEYVKNYVVE